MPSKWNIWLDVWKEGFLFWYARWRREDDPIGGKDTNCAVWGLTETHAVNRARKVLAQRECALASEQRRAALREQTIKRVRIEF